MTVLIGHPTGNPNSHQAALAHLEAGWLEAFCVPWMPSSRAVRWIESLSPSRFGADRISRRAFAPLEGAPRVQGVSGEMRRLISRAGGVLRSIPSETANDWLMRTMAREAHRDAVSVVHAYEDCSQGTFEVARSLNKRSVYDLPTGAFSARDRIMRDVHRRFESWAPNVGPVSDALAEQKRKELELADLVLVPSRFVERTLQECTGGKRIARAPYGVDAEFWRPAESSWQLPTLRVLFVGNLSLQKGAPLLVEAWSSAGIRDAQLTLVGSWQLAQQKRSALPEGVSVQSPMGSRSLREQYRGSDLLVFPSYFDGFGLVILEAMACGLPVIASNASAAPEIVDENCGRLFPSGEVDALIEALRWVSNNREKLGAMGSAARARAKEFPWSDYRRVVRDAVAPLV